MIFEETPLNQVWLIKPKLYKDERGHFLETFRNHLFRENELEVDFVQDNISTSTKNTLRGLHYQLPPFSQAKLITVPFGKILDVAVDVREHSPDFGKSFSAILDSELHHMMFIPPGFAHGFLVLSDHASVYYKCSNYYNQSLERGIRWNDPELKIEWNTTSPTLSEKDQTLPFLKELESEDLF